jgi:hypothetical protein
MTVEEYRKRFPDRQPPVPLEYAGQWLAWNRDCTQILAHADTLDEVHELVEKLGYNDPVFHKIPRGAFIGCL